MFRRRKGWERCSNRFVKRRAARWLELLPQARLQRGDILVVGCSTSEVAGERIGSASNTDIAAAIFEGVHPVLARAGIFLAAQCCEHLNRALILEREAARLYRARAGERGAPAQGGRLLCHSRVGGLRCPRRGRACPREGGHRHRRHADRHAPVRGRGCRVRIQVKRIGEANVVWRAHPPQVYRRRPRPLRRGPAVTKKAALLGGFFLCGDQNGRPAGGPSVCALWPAGGRGPHWLSSSSISCSRAAMLLSHLVISS